MVHLMVRVCACVCVRVCGVVCAWVCVGVRVVCGVWCGVVCVCVWLGWRRNIDSSLPASCALGEPRVQKLSWTSKGVRQTHRPCSSKPKKKTGWSLCVTYAVSYLFCTWLSPSIRQTPPLLEVGVSALYDAIHITFLFFLFHRSELWVRA